MKHQISSNTSWKRYIFAVIALSSLFIIIKATVNNQHINENYLYSLYACTIVSFSLYYLIRKRKNLSFDAHYLYINDNERIAYRDIKQIYQVIFQFNKTPSWKIEYQTERGREKVWLISSKKEEEAYHAFFDKIKKEHPHISLKEDSERIL